MFSLAYGLIAYALFLTTFLYAIAFTGNIFVAKSIDTGAPVPLPEALIVNLILLGIFAVQHSVMARRSFKRWWTRIVPPAVERSTYVLFASIALLMLYALWQPIPAPVWTLHGPIAAVLEGTFWLGWAVLVASTFMLSHFELFGLSQVFARLFGKQL